MGNNKVPLCYKALELLFGASSDLYRAVKGTNHARAPPSAGYTTRTATVTRTGLLLNKEVKYKKTKQFKLYQILLIDK
jgi:hypothetical protein